MEAMSKDQTFNMVDLRQNYFDSVPDELTEIILNLLSAKDQLAAEGVCQKWREFVKNGNLKVDYVPSRGRGWTWESPEFYVPFYDVGIDSIGGCYIGVNNMGGGYKLPKMETKEGQISKRLAEKVCKVVHKAYFEQKKDEKESLEIRDKIKEAFKNRVWEGNDLNHETAKEAHLYDTKQIYIPSDDMVVDSDGSISFPTIYSSMPAEFVEIKLPQTLIEPINELFGIAKKYEKVAHEIADELKTHFKEINEKVEFGRT